MLDILVWPRSTDELRIWGSGPLPLRLGFGPTLTKPVCRDWVANPKSNRARPRVYNAAYIRKGDPSRFSKVFTCVTRESKTLIHPPIAKSAGRPGSSSSTTWVVSLVTWRPLIPSEDAQGTSSLQARRRSRRRLHHRWIGQHQRDGEHRCWYS
jgi:hypothetical protein